jgi:beta-lactam-binding protein with PASTA domain
VNWRGPLRRLMPYLVALGGGFLLAFLIVAFFVFPAGVIPDDIRVPNVIGLSYTDAVRALDQRGFKGERGEQRFHNAAPKGTVLDQAPAGGNKEVPGTRVSLVVSSGQRFATIPSLIGLSREQALNTLEDAGFDVGEVTTRASNEPYGAVIDARPRPGTQAPTPSTVSIVISSGPTTIVVPDLIGRPVSDATTLLRQVGLNVGEIQYSGGSAADASAVVVAQSPPAHSQAAAGSRVNLSVGARGP